jgi:hypothetical protein
MVESISVATPDTRRMQPPIGVLRSLVTGFDRVAGAPVLVLPAFLLDLFLWFGPRLRVTGLVDRLVATLVAPPGSDQTLLEQIAQFRQALVELGGRFNLFSALRSLPIGVPSLMAGRMPADTPLGSMAGAEVPSGLMIVGVWLVLSLLGVGMGSLYHVWVARRVAPQGELTGPLAAWGQMAVLTTGAYAAAVVVVAISMLVATAMALVLPLLGVVVGFLGFSLLLWIIVYLIFTPHGIIRNRLGVVRSVIESVQIVRWNLLGTVGFLSLAFMVSYATNWVWSLPGESSWFSLLAVVGHAFVSATLLAGSYVFYQGRRDWMLQVQRLVTTNPSSGTPPQLGA